MRLSVPMLMCLLINWSAILAAAEPKLLKTFRGHEWPVQSVAFSPDGKSLVSGSDDRTIRFWDLATGKNIATLVAHAGEKDETGLFRVGVNVLAFSPNGRLLASGGADKTVKLWTADTRENITTLTGHADSVRSIAFSPDGKTLFSAGVSIKRWDVATGRNIATMADEKSGFVALSPDGKSIVIGDSDHRARLLNFDTGKVASTFEDPDGYFASAAFSPNGKLLATGTSTPSGKNLRICSVGSAATTFMLEAHWGSFGAETVRCVVFSPDGTILASGGQTCHLWDVASGRHLAELQDCRVSGSRSLAFSPDGKMLAVAMQVEYEIREGKREDIFTVQLWDVTEVNALK